MHVSPDHEVKQQLHTFRAWPVFVGALQCKFECHYSIHTYVMHIFMSICIMQPFLYLIQLAIVCVIQEYYTSWILYIHAFFMHALKSFDFFLQHVHENTIFGPGPGPCDDQ